MKMQFYEFAHSLGIHVWEIPALAVALAMIVVGLVHWRNQRKREEDFEKELEEKGQQLRDDLAAASDGKGGF